jgi:hypothetical protein
MRFGQKKKHQLKIISSALKSVFIKVFTTKNYWICERQGIVRSPALEGMHDVLGEDHRHDVIGGIALRNDGDAGLEGVDAVSLDAERGAPLIHIDQFREELSFLGRVKA